MTSPREELLVLSQEELYARVKRWEGMLMSPEARDEIAAEMRAVIEEWDAAIAELDAETRAER